MKNLIENLKLDLASIDGNCHCKEQDSAWICTMSGQEAKRFPKACVHEIYSGLTAVQLNQLESIIQRPLPDQLKEFYQIANGLNLFYGSLSIGGLVGIGGHQPISLEYGTVIDRPIENGKFIDNSNQIRFGGYGIGHIDLMIYLDDPRVFAVRRFREGPIYYEWPNLKQMISSEVERMIALYKKNNGEVDPLNPFAAPWM